MIPPLLILLLVGGGILGTAPQATDRRTFVVVTPANVSGFYSVYAELADDLAGPADRANRVVVYRLSDSLFLRVVPQSHVAVERGAFAYSFQLSRDATGRSLVQPTNQPGHGLTSDTLRAADFRNSDNAGPNEIGPKNVNAAGEFRQVEYDDYSLEIRVLSFEIVGLGSARIPAFARVSCL